MILSMYNQLVKGFFKLMYKQSKSTMEQIKNNLKAIGVISHIVKNKKAHLSIVK